MPYPLPRARPLLHHDFQQRIRPVPPLLNPRQQFRQPPLHPLRERMHRNPIRPRAPLILADPLPSGPEIVVTQRKRHSRLLAIARESVLRTVPNPQKPRGAKRGREPFRSVRSTASRSDRARSRSYQSSSPLNSGSLGTSKSPPRKSLHRIEGVSSPWSAGQRGPPRGHCEPQPTPPHLSRHAPQRVPARWLAGGQQSVLVLPPISTDQIADRRSIEAQSTAETRGPNRSRARRRIATAPAFRLKPA